MSRRYFGTDGIRGRVGEPPITPDFMLKLGWAAGQVMAKQGERRVVIGKDTRISGYMFESVLEAGLSAAGVDVVLLGPMPTPAIAYLTRTLGADAGIVISASHNPFYDNGIKFFSRSGMKLADTVEEKIEAMLEQPFQMVPSEQLGKATRVADAPGRYIEYCKGTFPYQLDLRGLSIILDCAHGATYHIAPSVFRELGAKVTTIGVEPNGININVRSGSTEPATLIDQVQQQQADLGIAFDGDGDRVLFVDRHGRLVDGDELIYLIACYGATRPAGVVGTQMTNLAIEQALQQQGIAFERAAVGDRYVLERLQQRGWSLGGESSGHIIDLTKSTTGDGIVAALQVLAALRYHSMTLTEALTPLKKFPQRLINVRLTAALSAPDLVSHPELLQVVATAEQQLGHSGRVLLRPSGTEPLIRVMVEGSNATQIDQLGEQIAAVVRNLADRD